MACVYVDYGRKEKLLPELNGWNEFKIEKIVNVAELNLFSLFIISYRVVKL